MCRIRSGCRPIEFHHQLKLYANDTEAIAQQPSKKPVVNEVYEELVFMSARVCRQRSRCRPQALHP